jgi:hypothetical protein
MGKAESCGFRARGCGKTLLLHDSSRKLDETTKSVYLNCEDFKRHSFPNVLIEILDALFGELERHLTGWFGKKKRSRQLIQAIRKELSELREAADVQDQSVRKLMSSERHASAGTSFGAAAGGANAKSLLRLGEKAKDEIESSYKIHNEKIRELDMWLPKLKRQARDFFDTSTSVKAVFLQIDDFYHLKKQINLLL